MEPWEVMISESQERMVAIVAPERLADVQEVCDRWELHHAVVGEVTDTGELPRLLGRRARRRDPGPLPDRRVPAVPGRARSASPPPEVAITGAPPDGRGAARAARLGRAPLAALRLPPLRPARPVAHGAPARARRRRAAAAAVATAASPSRSTARAGSAPSTRSPAERSPCSRPPATSPASAASRSASPTASTSATRRRRRSAGSSPRRSRASRRPARRSASRSSPGTSPSTTTRTAARSRRRRSSAASGLVPDVRLVPRAWQPGDKLFLASAGRRSAGRLRVPGALRHDERRGHRELDLDAEAALVRFLASRRTTLLARPRRLRRRPRRRARRGGPLVGRRGRARPP